MAERVQLRRTKRIPKDLRNFERAALRVKMCAAAVYARDAALESGGTDEQFAKRMRLTVRQFYRRILSVLKDNIDDVADMATALELHIRVGSKPIQFGAPIDPTESAFDDAFFVLPRANPPIGAEERG